MTLGATTLLHDAYIDIASRATTPERLRRLSLAIDAALLTLFAVQHSVMARGWFKAWMTQYVSPAIERWTYVLCTNLALLLMFWQWRPLGGVVWQVDHPVA